MFGLLGEIDLNKKIATPELFVCRPNKTVVGKMNEASNVTFNEKLGSLNQLTFTLPQFVERHHKMIQNKNVLLLKGRFLIKMIFGHRTEYFVVHTVARESNESDLITFTALSLGIQLNDKLIRGYKGESKNCTEFIKDALKDTNWEVGYVDSDFDLKYRTIEITANSRLEFITTIATTFGALILWDTNNMKIHFYKMENIGQDRGFRLKYGKYLEGLNKEENYEEVITVLKPLGKDGMMINELNPTGSNYIEDFSYFIYPFERDENTKEVLEHSNYMTDELCHAILDYKKLCEDKQEDFQSLLNQKEVLRSQLKTLETELYTLNTQLKIILDERDYLLAMQEDPTDKNVEKDAKQIEVDNKENEIVAKNSEITDVDNNIRDLGILLSLENNFVPELIEERKNFVIEREWEDGNITDPEDLLKEAKNVLEEYKNEKITISLELVNFFSMITEQRNWDKLAIGDTVVIDHEKMRILLKAKISEINYDFEGDDISVTVTNVQDIYSNKDKFMEMLYQSYGSSIQVNADRWKWDYSEENKGAIDDLINGIWDANKNAIMGAKNQVVSISDRGLIIRNPDDPLKYLVGTNGVLGITNDGGNTWKNAITWHGVVGERIYHAVLNKSVSL